MAAPSPFNNARRAQDLDLLKSILDTPGSDHNKTSSDSEASDEEAASPDEKTDDDGEKLNNEESSKDDLNDHTNNNADKERETASIFKEAEDEGTKPRDAKRRRKMKRKQNHSKGDKRNKHNADSADATEGKGSGDEDQEDDKDHSSSHKKKDLRNHQAHNHAEEKENTDVTSQPCHPKHVQRKNVRRSLSAGTTRSRPPYVQVPTEQSQVRKLEKKFEELQELLKEQVIDRPDQLSRQLLSQSKQILRRYRMLHQPADRGGGGGGDEASGSNVTPAVHPPAGAPPSRNGQRRRARSAVNSRRDKPSQTFTEHAAQEANSNSKGKSGEYGYVDLSHMQGGLGAPIKHVTFAGNEGESLGSEEHEGDIRTTEQERDQGRGRKGAQRGTRRVQSARIARRSVAQRSRTRSHSSGSSSGSRSPARSKDDKQRQEGKNIHSQNHAHSDSESESKSSSSRERKIYVGSDNQLKNTQNNSILKWLRRKTRYLRKQRAEERKKEKEKRLEDEKEMKAKLAHREESDKKVRQWIQFKRRETRLLRKREREKNQSSLTNSGEEGEHTTEATVDETVDLQNGEVVNEETMTRPKVPVATVMYEDDKAKTGVASSKSKPEPHLAKPRPMRPRSSKNSRRPPKQEQQTQGEGEVESNCDVKTEENTLHGEELRSSQSSSGTPSGISMQGKSVLKPRRTTQSPQRSKTNLSKDNVRGSKQNSQEPTTDKSQRESYDDWMKKKSVQERKQKKNAKKNEEELLSKSDPEMDNIVTKMARKRTDNILSGKKRISTGLAVVDDAVNKSLDERIAEKNASNERPTASVFLTSTEEPENDAQDQPNNPYRWKHQADEQGSQRPQSASAGHAQKKRGERTQRPASAVNGTRGVPTPSRSVKSPAPPRNREDGNQESEANPFKVPWKEGTPRRATSPKPKVQQGEGYPKVKYQQRSWDEFSDYVWDKLNAEETDGEPGGNSERPEPQGCDTPTPVAEELASDTSSQRAEAESAVPGNESNINTPKDVGGDPPASVQADSCEKSLKGHSQPNVEEKSHEKIHFVFGEDVVAEHTATLEDTTDVQSEDTSSSGQEISQETNSSAAPSNESNIKEYPEIIEEVIDDANNEEDHEAVETTEKDENEKVDRVQTDGTASDNPSVDTKEGNTAGIESEVEKISESEERAAESGEPRLEPTERSQPGLDDPDENFGLAVDIEAGMMHSERRVSFSLLENIIEETEEVETPTSTERDREQEPASGEGST